MKRGLIILLIGVFLIQFTLAETTFFEGDLGYRDDFIMAPIPEGEIIQGSLGGKPAIEPFISGGGFLVREEGLSSTILCPLIFESLKDHITKKRSIDYTEKELETLAFEVNQELGKNLSIYQVSYIIDNFEDTCNSPLPLLRASALGRFVDILSPFVFVIGILILIFIVYIGYKIISVLRRNKKKRK